MSVPLQQIERSEKRDIARALYATLSARFRKGQPEQELDNFLPQLVDVAARLDAPPGPRAETERQQRIAAVVSADDEVDTYLRHIEGYLAVEAMRRMGPNAALARALHDLAFPEGLAHIDDRIVEENFHCRTSLAVLRAPEHASTLGALAFPMEWLDRWEEALDASDAAISEILRTVAAQGDNPSEAPAPAPVERDPEADWVDLMARMRRYVSRRAERDDVARIEEGRELLRPLFDALQKLRLADAARPARRV
ncbi:MAG: hypothetical protein QM820_08935 [Minicystis sp.]